LKENRNILEIAAPILFEKILYNNNITWILLNIAKNTREQIHLKIQGFQQQGTSKNTKEQIYLLMQGFQQQGSTRDQFTWHKLNT